MRLSWLECLENLMRDGLGWSGMVGMVGDGRRWLGMVGDGLGCSGVDRMEEVGGVAGVDSGGDGGMGRSC
jgi:hypothetical protein